MNNNATTLVPGSAGFHLDLANGFTLSIQYGAGNYCDSYGKTFDGAGTASTTTMEVAIMKGGEFVVLPHDVAGYVPVSVLGSLIASVEAHDWEHVCLLCGELGEPDYSKFPQKQENGSYV